MKSAPAFTSRLLLSASAAVLCAFTFSSAHAATFGGGLNGFTIDFVPVGDAGNAADTTGYGAVPYDYNVATYAISQTQIIAASASGLTNVTAGPWTGSQPAANMTWYQAAAFVNWLNTSTGHTAAYQLDAGATALTLWSPAEAWQLGGQNLFRNKNAYYFLPSEDESYKAAYYDPNKAGGAGYWLYATGSNSIPTAVLSGTGAGTAVYGGSVFGVPAAVNNAGGLSPYRTMGQGGNVWEWQESAYTAPNNSPSGNRVVRGGDWGTSEFFLRSSLRGFVAPTNVSGNFGFRVASVSVPEPTSAALIFCGGTLLALRRRRG